MSPSQLYQQASGAHREGRFQQAELLYRQLLQHAPRHADGLHMLGILCYQTERAAEAAELIAQAIALEPRNADMLINHGLTLRAAGKPQEALKSYERAMLLTPKDLVLQNNLGNLYQELGRFEDAAACYRRVLRVHPGEAEVRDALGHSLLAWGNACQDAGRYAEAERCYEEALTLAPNDAALHFNLGNARRELGKTAQAAASYQRAIALAPDDADAHNNLGNALRELGQLPEAIVCYQRALALKPDLYHARVHLIHQQQHAADWRGLMQQINEVRGWLHSAPHAQISPFAFLAMPGTTVAEQRLCADRWLENRYSSLAVQAPQLAFTHIRHENKHLRIGYLSADFRRHPLAALVTELLELHDRDHLEVFAYSYGMDDNSPERQRLQHAVDHFVDIRALSLVEAAQRIHDDGIDILVDLTGFTQSSRTGIVALRPAPININWLGFPGTMGSLHGKPLFDYVLSDAYITPGASQPDYAERLLLLPGSYQPNDRNRPIGKTPARVDYGLPEEAFVYCCFNQSFKITPTVFACWMRILQQAPNSVLWLLDSNATATANLQQAAKAAGVDPARLVFAPRVAMADHLARHALADLFIDTLPYNAHTTASDALWMCLPVLTCSGDTFASRVAGSLLHAVNLPELIAPDMAAYEAMAISLAQDMEALEGLRERLQQASADLPLFDTRHFAQKLEAVYQDIWRAQR
ncbi:tetratricopeptide repeat protein [Methylovorus menthalis]|uniref:O-linked N-acetylglucosamine transferase, SPINDLY family protein n=1 Tax=Methylovorus menthalis TaxID=1002227 RepID=UPI001E4899D0|nr:glycosyltransferase family 41 protein [Methylovorus menthalis]MCB4811830.1 tetratricopeptide repeat protein [Methylovorus menthalis]